MTVTTASTRDVSEWDFEGPVTPIPGDRVPLTVRFRHDSGWERDVLGFWDGDRRYAVRFSPPLPGRWEWTTRSEAAELHRRHGRFEAVPGKGRGPVRVASRFHFAHADGTPYRPVGATVYNWIHQDDALRRQTVDAVVEAGFNKLRFMVFPQAGGYIEHEPDLMPFEKTAGRWDVSKPVPAFFRRLDDLVARLGERGIQADVLIFNAYDRGHFGLDELSEEEDAAYLRYLVARLGAHPHVWWSLCNEFDLLTDRPADRWDRMGVLLSDIDAHGHLRSIHNWMELHDHNQPWVTHASIQNGQATTEFGRAGLYRDVYRKPVVLDEIKYEGDIPERWGHLSGEQLVHQFWIATVSGTYASHGESFVTESGSLHMVEGGRLRGASPPRLRFLREVLDSLRVAGLDPIDKWDDPAHVAGVARDQYVQYLGQDAPDSWTFRLPQGNTGERLQVGDVFTVDVLDSWNMTRTRVPEDFVLTDVHRNDAYAAGAEPVALPEGEALALLITRVDA